MDDLISRKAAIERIKLQMDRPDTFGWWTRNDKIAEACYKIAIEILERLPSADEPSQVARDIATILENEKDMRILPKRGRWIHPYEYWLALPEHKCSVCGEWEYADSESNYCPNCGARMDGD